MQRRQKVGMIGLGAMGMGMAARLQQAGLLSGVYNRTPEKMQKFNVKRYDSPETLAADMNVVFLCVSADKDVLDIVHAISRTIKPHSIVVDMSTISSNTAQQAADCLAKQAVAFLDAPVSGGVEGAKNGTLSMMVGGDAATLEIVRPTLAVAQAQNLPMNKVIEVISGGAAGNWFLQHRGLTMTQSNYNSGFKLALHHKDLNIAQNMARQTNTPTPLTDMTIKDYQRLIDKGYGDEDISALYRLKKQR